MAPLREAEEVPDPLVVDVEVVAAELHRAADADACVATVHDSLVELRP